MLYNTQHAARENRSFLVGTSESTTLTFPFDISGVLFHRVDVAGRGQIFLGKKFSSLVEITGNRTVSVIVYSQENVTVDYSVLVTAYGGVDA